MLGRLSRLRSPLPLVSRSQRLKPHQNSHSKLLAAIAHCHKRHIGSLRPLLFSSQMPKQKPDESEPPEDDKKSTSSSSKDEKSKEKEEEEKEKENSKKKEKQQQQQQQRKGTIFVKDLMLHSFSNSRRKEKETFLECLRMYQKHPGRRRERVPFIYAALKYMEEFGVERDLAVYKQIIDIFPKEKMIPTNVFQTMYVHYPREQYCCVDILEQMENYGVMPDPEMEQQLLNVFGQYGMPLEKYWKMMYWMPKFRHANPWPVPKPLPDDVLELAKLAIKKISSIDVQSSVEVFDTKEVEDSVEKTWIVSSVAPMQSELLRRHDRRQAIFVEGPFRIYVATKCVDYFQMRAESDKNRRFPDDDPDAVDKIRNPYLETKSTDIILAPSVHEQEDGTYFGICATGTSMKDSLLSWIRLLQKTNPVLADIPIVFTLRNYSEEKFYLSEDEKAEKQIEDDGNKKLLKD